MFPFAILFALTTTSHNGMAAEAHFLRSHIDSNVKPGDDFYSYSMGGWFKKNPIPANESSWGIGNLMRDQIYAQERSIDETAAGRKNPLGSDAQKVGDFWATAMDPAKAERVGLEPLKPMLEAIDKAHTPSDCFQVGLDLQRIGINAFYGCALYPDEKKSDVIAVHIFQGGLGLPDKSFYFDKEAGIVKIRNAYPGYIAQLLDLEKAADPAGGDSAGSTAAAGKILGFEAKLANISRALEDLRDPESNYHKMPIADVKASLTPNIDWVNAFGTWGIKPTEVIVGQPEFLKGMGALLDATPVETLRSYLRFQLIKEYAPYLNQKADEIDFHFWHEVVSGQKAEQPRWKRALSAENRAIGFVLGRQYVGKYFPPAIKTRYANLVEMFRHAYAQRIRRLTWMSPETKAKALVKLAVLGKKVGYPDKWKDYSKLEIGRTSWCDNMMNAARWEFQDELNKFGKPVDHTEWDITPQTFDAYYDPTKNEIVLPAVSLMIPGLPPQQTDDAVMMGNTAGWIGHEMTHGFDDQGRQFDPKGNLKNWWTKEDAVKFQKRADVMVKEFNRFSPLPGMHINGKATLGENIADYGGILIGLDAFKQTPAYKSGRKIGGFTPLQRYFLGYAIGWLEEDRPQVIRRELLSDVHSPAKYRVNGPLANIPDFYKAFGVRPGQPMWRASADRVDIW
jgi:putative endopeptidase